MDTGAQGSGFSLPDGTFDLVSLNITTITERASHVQVYGFADGMLVEARTVELFTNKPQAVQFDWRDVDQVSFDVDFGTYFMIDDVVIGNIDRPAAVPPSGAFGWDHAHLDGHVPAAPSHLDTAHPTQLV